MYARLAQDRIDAVQPTMFSDEVYVFDAQKRPPRIPFGALLEHGLLSPANTLCFSRRRDLPRARSSPTARSSTTAAPAPSTPSAARITNAPCNGWEHWYYEDKDSGDLRPLDDLRKVLRAAGAREEKAKAAPGG